MMETDAMYVSIVSDTEEEKDDHHHDNDSQGKETKSFSLALNKTVNLCASLVTLCNVWTFKTASTFRIFFSVN